MTAEKFVPHPFSKAGGERLYQTGDLVRYKQDGTIEYIGRIDHQVKIRGYRIELGEIESALCEHSEINNSVVIANKDVNGYKYLSAYYVSEKEIDISEIRGFLGKTLPEYMIPSIFIRMDSFPLTANGKINKDSLPDPMLEQISTGAEFVRAENAYEKILSNIWKKKECLPEQ